MTDGLEVEDGRVRCSGCGADICAADENPKLWALQEAVPVDAIPGMGDPAPYEMRETLEMRRFYCPGCARQIAVEIAPPGAPPLWDVELTP
jgi:N-methylhydantoinase B